MVGGIAVVVDGDRAVVGITENNDGVIGINRDTST